MGVIKVKRIDVRRVVEDACYDLISDEKLAEMVYVKIMQPLEDYLDDCEEEKQENGMEWIPVSKRLPLNDSLALVTRKGEKGYEPNTYYSDIAWYYANLKEWTQDWEFLGDATSKVIAWMPLPEPWKGE